MINRAAPPQHQRFAVLAAVVILHAALIAFFLLLRSTVVPPDPKAASIAMIAINAERPAAAKPPPPALPAELADTFKPVVALSAPADEESDAAAGASASCSTLDVLRNAILADPVALAAVRSAPADARSIADAIVLWNDGWSAAAITPEAPLGPVRANVERILAAIPGACLDEAVSGPRLMLIPDDSGEKSMILAFGSGNWAWRTLLLPPVSPSVAKPIASLTLEQ